MKVEWLDRTMITLPLYYVLCTTKKMFDAETKRLGVVGGNFISNEHSHATTHFIESKDNRLCAIVTMDMTECRKRDQVVVFGLLIHEAVHIIQKAFERIGEHSPGDETEAYAVQWVSQQLLRSYVKQFKSRRGCESSRR
jgi:hypothetical protein